MQYLIRFILTYSLFLAVPTASAQATENAVNKKYLSESVIGEYIDLSNDYRMWISDTEMHKVAFGPIQKSNDLKQQLIVNQIINTLLTLQPKSDNLSVRSLLNKLTETGISVTCTTTLAKFIVSSPANRTAIVRFPSPREDQVVDMLLQRSDPWVATYMSFRSKELSRVGALPFLDAKESALAKEAPLENLPFTASRILYRTSTDSKPNINWCAK
jgi:hypothetical protein